MALTQPDKFTLTIANAIASIATATTFKTQIEAVDGAQGEYAFTPVTREIEFKEPEVTTEEIKLLGATSGHQNQELDPQSPSKGEFTGTLLLNPEDDNEFDLEKFKWTAEGTPPTGYTRYNMASAEPTAGVAININFDGGSGKPIINWLLNNATVETLGGVKTDADGYSTQDIRITAAADDCWKEFDADGGS